MTPIKRDNCVLDLAVQWKKYGGYQGMFSGKVMYNLMFQKSNIVSNGYESATIRMGGNVVRIDNMRERTKNATMVDTLKWYGESVDILLVNCIRSQTLDYMGVHTPVVYGGMDEYYTQTIADFMTIEERLGEKDQLSVCFIGDITGSYNHLFYLRQVLNDFPNVRIETCAYPECESEDFSNISIESFRDRISEFDVVYCAPLRNNSKCNFQTYFGTDDKVYTRFRTDPSLESLLEPYTITLQDACNMHHASIIMHPELRTRELDPDVDITDRGAYYTQAKNRTYVQMAHLYLLFNNMRLPPSVPATPSPSHRSMGKKTVSDRELLRDEIHTYD